MSFILQRTQRAFKEAVESQAWTWLRSVRGEISRGAMDEDSTANEASNPRPAIIIQTPSAQQYTPTIATFDVQVAVILRHSADDTAQEDHLAHADEVATWIHGDSFIADLNAADGFTAFGRGLVSHELDRVGRSWQTTFNFSISAAPSNIS
jgi:hypothetical protein